MSKIFGIKLKTLRVAKNLTQKDLANALGSTIPTISAWETNRQEPSFDMLTAISKFFDVDEGFFFNDDKKLLDNSFKQSVKQSIGDGINFFNPLTFSLTDIKNFFSIDLIGTSKNGSEFKIKCYNVSLIHELDKLVKDEVISEDEKHNIITIILDCLSNPSPNEWHNNTLRLELG